MASETPRRPLVEHGPALDTAVLVGQLRPALVRFFRRRCGNLPEAEDLAQEAILRSLAHSRWSTVDEAKGYIFRTAVNLWRDRKRRQFTRRESELSWDEAITGSVSVGIPIERVLVSEEELHRIHAVLMGLNERTRDVFLLNRLEALKYSDIAATLGISVSAVEKHMVKALKAIAERIDDHESK